MVKHHSHIISLLFILVLLTGQLSAAHDYGFMYISGGSVETENLSNASWHIVGSGTGEGDDFAQGAVSNWNATDVVNELKVTTDGNGSYHIAFSLSFTGDQTTWSAGISKNGAAPTQTFARTISNTNKDAGTISGSVDLPLIVGDKLTMVVQPTDNNSDFKPLYAQVVAVEALEVGNTPMGSMSIYNGSTAITGLTDASYTQITGFSAGVERDGVTFDETNVELDVATGGIYFVNYHVSFIGDGNNPRQHYIGVVEDGANADPSSIIVTRTTSTSDVGVVSATGIMDLTAGKGIRMEVTVAGSNAATLTVKYANLLMVKLSGSEASPPYAGMGITSDQIVAISTLDTWTKVGDFTAGNMSSWSFDADADALNATQNSPSAGVYFAKYCITFKSADATGDENILFGIFVGSGGEHQDLTTERILSDNSDVGTVQGVGLISITSTNDAVSLKVKNVGITHNITVNSACINLYRMTETAHDGSLPVELIAFSGKSINTSVVLNWETASEIANLGFIIERRQPAEEWIEIASYKTDEGLRGQGSVTHNTSYSFSDQAVIPGQTYQYRLGDVDYSGKLKYHQEILVTVSAIEDTEHPQTFILRPAYPNPFNPATRIQYELLKEAEISVTIYDILGKQITTLVNQWQEPGYKQVSWDGTDWTGNQVGAGIYLYRIDAGNYSKTGKLILIK